MAATVSRKHITANPRSQELLGHEQIASCRLCLHTFLVLVGRFVLPEVTVTTNVLVLVIGSRVRVAAGQGVL